MFKTSDMSPSHGCERMTMNDFYHCKVFKHSTYYFLGIILLRSILLQVVFFVIIFNGASWFRETSMLATDAKMPLNIYKVEQVVTQTGKYQQENEEFFVQAQGKKTVLYFFAPWCQICNLSIENLEALHQKNKDLAIMAIALDYESRGSVIEFVQRHHLTFPVVYGTPEVKSAFKVKAYPSYYILNKENSIIGKSLGYSTETGLYLRTL